MEPMAEILICVHDRSTTGIQAVDVIQPMQGDVIVVVPNGWTWGTAELGHIIPGNPNGNHPFFRILKLPNVSIAAASTLLAPELPVDPLNPSPFLHFRSQFLDKSKIPPATMQNLIDHWNDDGRVQGFLSVPFTAAQINTIVSTRTRIPWP